MKFNSAMRNSLLHELYLKKMYIAGYYSHIHKLKILEHRTMRLINVKRAGEKNNYYCFDLTARTGSPRCEPALSFFWSFCTKVAGKK